MTPPTGASSVEEVLDSADRLMAAGDFGEALHLLRAANRRAPDPALEVQMVAARHRAFVAPVAGPTSAIWPAPVPDVFAGVEGVPEVQAADLTADHLASGLQHHGALLVRGLLTTSVAEMLLEEVRRAYAAAEAAASGAPAAETSPWYTPFEATDGYEFGAIEHGFWRFGAVLAVEAPRALFHVVESLRSTAAAEVIAEYLGEWPALSAKKTSLRRARPDAQSEWHQDGAFLGNGTRTVNVWTALTPCGVDAPSVDLVPQPFADIVPTGTDDAIHTWSVSREQAQRVGAGRVVRPEFAPGDALMFNQLTLHRTGTSPQMTRDRYAIESWFFAPSTYPYEQIPIAF